ncbi:MAG: AMP-binding protein [Pseudomonadales bacterium]|nr:AMP-binding protein [Pseudomonadales bacterium]
MSTFVSANNLDIEQAMTCGMVIAVWANNFPDRPAIYSDKGNRTFGELNTRINQVARVFEEAGLKPGDGAALICSNRPEYAEALMASMRCGVRLTPVNWHLTPKEMAHIVNDCEAKVLIGDARMKENLEDVLTNSPNVELALAVGGEMDGFSSYDDVVNAQDGSDLSNPTPAGPMLYTSGTTGHPKGVWREPGPLQMGVTITSLLTYDGEQDLELCTGPLYHAAPMAYSLMATLHQGVGVYLMDKWDAEETLRIIEEYKITHSHMVPTMFHRMLTLPEEIRNKYDISSMKYILHGAAPCPVHVKKSFMEWFGKIMYEYYGGTEGGGACFIGPEEWFKRPGSVGQPVLGGTLILGDDDKPLPVGEIGRIYMKAPDEGRFKYFKDDGKTDKAYLNTKKTHFTLGDMGYLDADDYLYLSDRRNDLILSGGVNIYPAEVDACLLLHPAVGDACTVGISNPNWGQEVLSVIEPKEGIETSDELAAELIQHCVDHIAKFKCPRQIKFMDELPRSDAGKIKRRLVRDTYDTGNK